MRIFYADVYELPLPVGHRFPILKYRRLREAVEASGLVDGGCLRVPAGATDPELLRVHDAGYLERVKTGGLEEREVRRLGFPWSPELVERSRRSVGGTIAACRAALADGCGVNLAGGTHHAFADRGEAFCVFNDAAVAARAMQAEKLASQVLVLDCDVHQGNGTARIFRDDPSVFTFSIHGRRNYPAVKETSDLDVELEDGTGDDLYLEALARALDRLPDLGRAQLAIYLAGADPWSGDRLGRLALSGEGLARRDRMILERCREAELPVAVVMGGGYAPRVADLVQLHLATVRAAVETFGAPASGASRL